VGFGTVVVLAAIIASIVAPTSRIRPVAFVGEVKPTIVRSGLFCPTEAEIRANDRGTLLVCAFAKDRKLRWRRV
jgi:hypothetical protein